MIAGALVGGGFFIRNALERGIVATFQKRFQSDVEIQSLHVSLFPHITATAEGVVVRTKDRPDPPLITIRRLTLAAGLFNLLRRHISGIYLEGLQIRIPPRPPGASPASSIWAARKVRFALVIDVISSSDALLETLPSDATHTPRDFLIHELVLRSFSFENPAKFRTVLTNPLPAGEIVSEGEFGPWRADQPADTPISGSFEYSHVNFSSIKGLSGTMSSHGTYGGTLDWINVQGTTQMPDFALTVAGNPMPLATKYVAVVDGTTGNTYLNSVDARLGNSPIHVSGEIVGVPGARGRKISLLAVAKSARVEDLLHLAVKGAAPLRGGIALRAKIDLPPLPKGTRDAVKLMSLAGQFNIGDAHFTSPPLQGRVDRLSRAGQGEPKNRDIKEVPFRLAGNFTVNQGAARFPEIHFDLQGAAVQMAGSYGLDRGDLDFKGQFSLDAKASQATTGVKSFVLRVVDPLFEKNGKGFSISFKILGDRDHPIFLPGK